VGGAENDVLLGVLAVRHGYVSAEAVIRARHEADPAVSLLDALTAGGYLKSEARRALEARAAEWRDEWPVESASRVADAPPESPPKIGPTVDGPTMIPTHRGGELASLPGPVDVHRPYGAVTPEAVGRYEPNARELGRGGIGRVLAVYDRHLGRRVAIKELLPADGGQIAESDLIRFLREARVTGQLEHPNIVPVHELGQRADGTLYYSMKIVRGRTMRKALRQAATLEERIRLLPHYVDLVNAIAYAHSRGVVHRDIKPDNVMLGEFGETIVLDWGLTKVRGEPDDVVAGSTLRRQRALLESDTDSATRAGDVLGTPAYMSPEQASGDVGRVDERSDVWSLGAVLFELLTGEPPFRGTKPMEMLWRVAEGDIPKVVDVEPSAPRDLAAVAQKALNRRRADRYADAASLVEDVEAFMTGQRVGAYRYTALELVRKFIVEHRAAAAATFSIVFVVLVGGISTFAAYQRALVEQQRARVAERRALEAKAASEASRRRASEHLSTALYEKAKLLADERDFGAAGVYAAGALFNSPWIESSPASFPDLAERDAEARAKQRLPLRSAMYEALVGSSMERELSIATPRVCGFDLSDDGRFVVASSRDGALTRWDLETRASKLRIDAPKCPRFLDIDPSGRWVAYTDVVSPLTILELRSGSTRAIEVPVEDPWMVQFSPDGRSLVVASSDDRIVRLRTGTWEVVASTRQRAPRVLRFSSDGETLAVGSRWGALVLLDAMTLNRRVRFTDHGSTVYAVAFSPDDRRIASAGFEGEIAIRPVGGGAEPTVLPGTKIIRGLAWTGDRILATGVDRARLWSVRDESVLQIVRRHPAGIGDVRVGPDGHTLVTAGIGKDIDVWSLGDIGGWRAPQPGLLFAVAASNDGRWIATVDDTERIQWIDATRRVPVWQADEPTVWDVEFARDRLLSITSRGRVRAWDRRGASWILQDELPARREVHVAVDVAPSRELAAWTAANDRVVVWDLIDDRPRERLSGALEGQSSAVAFSRDGDRLAVGDDSGGVAVWKLGETKPAWVRDEAHDGIVSGLAFSPDGSLVSTAEDGRIRWWDASTGAAEAEMGGHDGWVNEVVFSPDGRFMATASDDRTARVWDAKTRRPRLELRAENLVSAIDIDPTRSLVLVGLDEALRVLPLELSALSRPAPKLLERAQRRAGLRLEGFVLAPMRGEGER